MSSEKYNLKWNDFGKCVGTSFKDLLYHQEFSDVSLVSEDGKQIKAHKVILSVSSPEFKNILLLNSHPHPVIFLSGVLFEDLNSLVEFMYLGQVDIAQDQMARFLEIANKFKINGLIHDEADILPEHIQAYLNDEDKHFEVSVDQDCTSFYDDISLEEDFSISNDTVKESTNSILTEHLLSCSNCSYKTPSKGNLTKHIKALHEGIRYTCDSCKYSTGFTSTLARHKRSQHSTGII